MRMPTTAILGPVNYFAYASRVHHRMFWLVSFRLRLAVTVAMPTSMASPTSMSMAMAITMSVTVTVTVTVTAAGDWIKVGVVIGHTEKSACNSVMAFKSTWQTGTRGMAERVACPAYPYPGMVDTTTWTVGHLPRSCWVSRPNRRPIRICIVPPLLSWARTTRIAEAHLSDGKKLSKRVRLYLGYQICIKALLKFLEEEQDLDFL